MRRTASCQPASLRLRVASLHLRLEARVERPAPGELPGLRPDACPRAGEPCSAERRSLQDRRPVDRRVEDVGQPLHRPVGRDHAAVDAQHRPGRRALPVLLHGVEQVARLVGDGFKRCAREFGRAGIAGEPEDRARAPRRPNAARRARRRPARDRRSACRRLAAASSPLCAALPITFMPSRSHCTAAPATKIEPSSA